jgi:hypothetical protein
MIKLIYILVIIGLMVIGFKTKEYSNPFKFILWTIITIVIVGLLYLLVDPSF